MDILTVELRAAERVEAEAGTAKLIQGSRDETTFQPPCASAASSLPADAPDLPDTDLAAIRDTIDAFRR